MLEEADYVDEEELEKVYNEEKCREKELKDAYNEKFPEIPSHAFYYSPRNRLDKEWIKENLEKVVDCGFAVYDIPTLGLCLGITRWGYNHLDEEWMNLYEARTE